MKKYAKSVSPGRPLTEQIVGAAGRRGESVQKVSVSQLISELNAQKTKCAQKQDTLHVLKEQFLSLQEVNGRLGEARMPSSPGRQELSGIEERVEVQEDLAEQQNHETECLLQLATRMKSALVFSHSDESEATIPRPAKVPQSSVQSRQLCHFGR